MLYKQPHWFHLKSLFQTRQKWTCIYKVRVIGFYDYQRCIKENLQIRPMYTFRYRCNKIDDDSEIFEKGSLPWLIWTPVYDSYIAVSSY